MSYKDNIESDKYDSLLKNDINFKSLFNNTLRNFKLATFLIGTSFLLTSAYLIFKKPVWEGQFQIVLSEEESSLENLFNNDYVGFDISQNINSIGKNTLKTEVAILKSPSVLLPVFEFVKSSKIKPGFNLDNWRYNNWFNDSVDITLEKGTSVLSIKYRDVDKNIILPTLENISQRYQNYSGKDRKEFINRSKNYFDSQITFYKNKSSKSLRIAQEFAIDQDLTNLEDESDKEIINSINIEKIRVESANKIRILEEQLKIIENLEKDEEFLLFVAKNIPNLMDNSLIVSINQIERNLDELRTKYTEKSYLITEAVELKKRLLLQLRNEIINDINARKEIEKSILNAAKRPKGILLEYKELRRNAIRDNNTLIELEKQKRLLDLEEAKYKNPWDLITNPTLLINPVEPDYLITFFGGIISGVFIAFIVCNIKEMNKDIIYSMRDFRNLKNNKFILDLTNKPLQSWDEYIFLLMEKLKNDNLDVNKICFLSFQKNKKIITAEFKNKFDSISRNKINFKNKIQEIVNYEYYIILIEIGNISNYEVNNFFNKLDLLKSKNYGLVLFSSNNAEPIDILFDKLKVNINILKNYLKVIFKKYRKNL